MAKIAEAEEADNEIEELGSASIEEVRARLQEHGGERALAAVAVNGAAVPIARGAHSAPPRTTPSVGGARGSRPR